MADAPAGPSQRRLAAAVDDRFDVRAVTNRMRLAAAAFLNGLSRDQVARAQYPFDDEAERRDWDFVPKYGRNGLPLREMNGRQQALAQQLIATSVGLEGYSQVLAIMNFENVLRELNKDRFGLAAADFRDAGSYFVSVFGTPNMEHTWGWRLNGHHVSLNFTIVGGFCLAPTPLLLGAEPAEFGAFKPLKDDEDRGFDLLYALDDEQRRRAVFHDVAPPDFVTRVVSRLGEEEWPADHELGFDAYLISDHDREMLRWVRTDARGLTGAAMTGPQFERFRRLIAGYVRRLPDEAAAKHLERLDGLGLRDFTFAWAGALERGRPHYYRLQGPEFLVEFENVQANGNHIHIVWRDPENDFGDDLLLRHHALAHTPMNVDRLQSTTPRPSE